MQLGPLDAPVAEMQQSGPVGAVGKQGRKCGSWGLTGALQLLPAGMLGVVKNVMRAEAAVVSVRQRRRREAVQEKAADRLQREGRQLMNGGAVITRAGAAPDRQN